MRGRAHCRPRQNCRDRPLQSACRGFWRPWFDLPSGKKADYPGRPGSPAGQALLIAAHDPGAVGAADRQELEPWPAILDRAWPVRTATNGLRRWPWLSLASDVFVFAVVAVAMAMQGRRP